MNETERQPVDWKAIITMITILLTVVAIWNIHIWQLLDKFGCLLNFYIYSKFQVLRFFFMLSDV